jgi:hypothetical protein
MRVKNLGSRPAPASLLKLFGKVVRGQRPSITVERRQIPYWQERGWIQKDDTFFSPNAESSSLMKRFDFGVGSSVLAMF